MNPLIRAVFFSFALLSSGNVMYAQNDKSTDTSSFHSKLYLRIAPLSVFDWWGAMLPVGVEYRPIKWLSFIGEAGIPLFTYTSLHNLTVDTKVVTDIRFRGEIRIYDVSNIFEVERDTLHRFFVAIESFYRQQVLYQYGYGSYYVSHGGDIYDYASGTLHKEIWGFGLISGYKQPIRTRSHIEVFMGLGLKYFQIRHSNIPTTVLTKTVEVGYGGVDQNHLSDGKHAKLYIPFGVKLSYSLHNNKKNR